MTGIDEAGVTPSMHVGMLLRCFLCHESLHQPGNSYEYSPDGGWPFESRLISVFPYIARDGSVREQFRCTLTKQLKALQKSTRRAHNTPFATQNPFVTEYVGGECRNSTLCGDYCRDCTPECMIYLAHRDCWQVAFSCHHWSPFDWSRLAVQTRPFGICNLKTKIQPTVCHEDLIIPTLTSVPPIQGEVWTRLGRLLARVRLLPAELQLQILGHLGGTMFLSLLQAKRFVLEVMPQLRSVPTWAILPQPKSLLASGEESSGSLSCRSVTIKGRPYMCDLTLGRPISSESHLSIVRKAIRGVQFALGRFGLRGMRIWYEDRSFSPWLGETKFCWIGTIRCCDLSDLKVITDDLRIVKIESVNCIPTQPETSVMWWGDIPMVRSHILVRDVPDRQLHHYWSWKQFQYLPLESGEHYASGLTVYLSTNFLDVTGVVSHDPTDSNSLMAEYRDGSSPGGVPFHIAFSPGEHLSSVWLHLAQRIDECDRSMIVLVTNLGRVHFVGSYPLYRWQLERSTWVLVSDRRPARVHGLVLNIPELIAGTHRAPILGVSQDTTPPEENEEVIKPPLLPASVSGPTLPSPHFTYYLRNRKQLRFGFSTASLNNISSIHVRKRSTLDKPRKRMSWCVGMCICHDDSSIEVLGRWDPRDERSISKIYDASEGYLKSVSFHMSDYWRATIVRDITVVVTDAPWESQPLDVSSVVPMDPPDHEWNCSSTGDPPFNPGTRTFDCTQSSQRVAWWFTNLHDDISRDHGSEEIQAQGEYSDSSFGDPLKTIEVDCDGMVV